MKNFRRVAAQGEITIVRVGDVPKRDKIVSGTPLALENNKLVIGHSETGHHHVLERSSGVSVTVLRKAPQGMRVLHAILNEANALIHEREHDKHETIALPPGEYRFLIAREYDPYEELARRSMD